MENTVTALHISCRGPELPRESGLQGEECHSEIGHSADTQWLLTESSAQLSAHLCSIGQAHYPIITSSSSFQHKRPMTCKEQECWAGGPPWAAPALPVGAQACCQLPNFASSKEEDPTSWSNHLLRSLIEGKHHPMKTTQRNKQNSCYRCPFPPSNYISSNTLQI